MHASICVYVCVHVCMYVRTHTCIHTYMQTRSTTIIISLMRPREKQKKMLGMRTTLPSIEKNANAVQCVSAVASHPFSLAPPPLEELPIHPSQPLLAPWSPCTLITGGLRYPACLSRAYTGRSHTPVSLLKVSWRQVYLV